MAESKSESKHELDEKQTKETDPSDSIVDRVAEFCMSRGFESEFEVFAE